MNIPTLVTLVVVLIILSGVLYNFYKKKKSGQDITGCGSCNKDCPYNKN